MHACTPLTWHVAWVCAFLIWQVWSIELSFRSPEGGVFRSRAEVARTARPHFTAPRLTSPLDHINSPRLTSPRLSSPLTSRLISSQVARQLGVPGYEEVVEEEEGFEWSEERTTWIACDACGKVRRLTKLSRAAREGGGGRAWTEARRGEMGGAECQPLAI
jgi:hypothetical protein